MAITATDLRFVTFAAIGRPDMTCAALGASGIALYLVLRERSLRRALLVGNALTALACITHPCGELYAAGLLLFTLYFDRDKLGWRSAAAICLPYLIVLAGWGVYILQSPGDFVRQISGNIDGIGTEFSGVSRLSGLSSPLLALKREYVFRYGFAFGRYATTAIGRIPLIALAIYTLGVAGCLLTPSIRKHRGVRALLLYGALSYVTMAILDGFKSTGYLVHTMPLIAALLAICAIHYLTRVRRARWTVVLLMTIFAAVQWWALGHDFTMTTERWDYQNTLAFLRQSQAPSRIIAIGEFAFDYGFDSGMVDDLRLGYYTGQRAPFIVGNSIYRGWFIHSAKLEPAVHRYIATLLRDEYRLVFQNETYTVYQRISAGSGARR